MHAVRPEFRGRRLKSRKANRIKGRNAEEFVVAVVWRPYRSQGMLIKRFFILHFTPLSALCSCIMCKSSAVIVFACMKEAELAPWYTHSSHLMFLSSFWLSHSSSSSAVFRLISIRSWKLFWRLESSHELHYSLHIKILYANLLVALLFAFCCVCSINNISSFMTQTLLIIFRSGNKQQQHSISYRTRAEANKAETRCVKSSSINFPPVSHSSHPQHNETKSNFWKISPFHS